MYVNIRRYKITSGSFGELKQEVQQSFVPIVSKVPGFIEYFWLTAGDNEVLAINVFENRAGAEESVRKAADFIRSNKRVASLLPTSPEVITGEVGVHHSKVTGKRAA
jgi:hypothetical protein